MGAQVYCGKAVLADGRKVELYAATVDADFDEYFIREAVDAPGFGAVHSLHRRRPIGRYASFREAARAVERGLA